MWTNAIAAASGTAVEEFQFEKNFKGWLWKKTDKGSTFKRAYCVLAEEAKAREKRFSTANFSEIPPPPAQGSGANDAPPAAPSPGAPPSAKKKFRLLLYSEESCSEQVGGIALADLTEVALQEYGTVPIGAPAYMSFRFELPSTIGTWIVASDSEADRLRWLEELQRVGGFALNDKRPSRQKWDYEGPLETRKKNNSLGWKDRHARIRNHEFIVFREGTSQVIKETVDLRTCSLEKIKVKESGGSFRFRLQQGDEEGNFSDWGTTTEKLRTEWIDALLAAGCKLAASDVTIGERGRCDAFESRALSVGLEPCLVDFEGFVYVLKSSRLLLAGSWKKRFARLRGCRLTWSHAEDSKDIDGILCVDVRLRINTYAQASADKLWPMVLTGADVGGEEGRSELTLAVPAENLRAAWLANFLKVIKFARSVNMKRAAAIVEQKVAPAKAALRNALSVEDAERLKAEVGAAESEAAAELELCDDEDDPVIKHDSVMGKSVTDVRVASKALASAKKKRTFGRNRSATGQPGAAAPEPGVDTAKGGPAPPPGAPPAPPAAARPIPVPVVTAPPKKKEVTRASALPDVLPAANYAPEVLPAPVYPKNEPLVVAETSNSHTPVFNLQTGEGFVFCGQWTLDWIEIPAAAPAKGLRPDVKPSPPPPVFALRTDVGGSGQIARCY